MKAEPLVIQNVTKTFAGVPAVSDASLTVRPGEVLALLGENGAGKSTLMKVVAGVYPAGSYKGSVRLGERELRLRDVREAEAEGIVLVPQELHIAPNLSIAENVLMGVLPARFGVVDRRAMRERARICLALFGLAADPMRPTSVLSASEQRLLVISAALAKSAARVLILDEPTASLTDGEARHLFDRIRQISLSGVATILITHRLDEIGQICDRAAVMRNGRVVLETSDVSGRHDALVAAMIGRDPERRSERRPAPGREIRLAVSNLNVSRSERAGKPYVEDASLEVRQGEIVGLFGLVGAGRTELARAVFGAWSGAVSGKVTIGGKEGRPASPREAIGRGLAMLTEDRKRSGLIEGQSVLFNTSAASINGVSRLLVIQRRKERRRDFELVRNVGLRPLALDAAVETFSGGNQQKIMLARWLATDPDVLIVDEPTYGVDIGARFEIYRLLRGMAESGKSILMISSDLDEVMNEADRIYVMYKGRITAEYPHGVSRHALMAAATGQPADATAVGH